MAVHYFLKFMTFIDMLCGIYIHGSSSIDIFTRSLVKMLTDSSLTGNDTDIFLERLRGVSSSRYCTVIGFSLWVDASVWGPM